MIRPNPCWRCGARASCQHREVEDVQLPKLGRRPSTADLEPMNTGRGKGNLNSPWGAKGNPSGKARQRMLEALKAQTR